MASAEMPGVYRLPAYGCAALGHHDNARPAVPGVSRPQYVMVMETPD